MPTLKISQTFDAKKEDVFDKLFDLKRLPEMLEEKIEVEVEHLAEKLEKGSEYAFSMARFGFEQNIRISVNECLPNERVVYRQTEGLFVSWVHTTRLESVDDKTLVTEIAEYQLPFGLLGQIASDLYVKEEMKEILQLRLDWAKTQLN